MRFHHTEFSVLYRNVEHVIQTKCQPLSTANIHIITIQNMKQSFVFRYEISMWGSVS